MISASIKILNDARARLSASVASSASILWKEGYKDSWQIYDERWSSNIVMQWRSAMEFPRQKDAGSWAVTTESRDTGAIEEEKEQIVEWARDDIILLLQKVREKSVEQLRDATSRTKEQRQETSCSNREWWVASWNRWWFCTIHSWDCVLTIVGVVVKARFPIRWDEDDCEAYFGRLRSSLQLCRWSWDSYQDRCSVGTRRDWKFGVVSELQMTGYPQTDLNTDRETSLSFL